MTQDDLSEIPDRSQRQTRTEDFGIVFDGGLAVGWAFGVTEAFKESLDIRYSQYVDKERSQELRKRHQKGDGGRLPTAHRMAWSRGVPPLLNFAQGHIFYDPPAVQGMVWADALKIMQRIVQVTDAKMDDPPGTGWVSFTLTHYADGRAIEAQKHILSQVQFEAFLRAGRL